MKKTVLVIDDDLDTISLISLVLEQEDYEVISTTSVEEGLGYFTKYKPAVLIMDLEMPSMHGVQVLKKIQPSMDKDFSVIILTGYGHDTNVKICYDLGVYAFLSKPVRLVELKGLVRNALLWEEYKTELREHKKNLEKIVDKRTHNLMQEIDLRKAAEQQLVSANQIKDRILHILTMDLRPPLSNVVMNLSYIYQNFDSLEKPEIHSHLVDIYNEAKISWQLTENLFLWARCQKGEIISNPEACNLNSIVNDILLSYSHQTKDKKLKISCEIDLAVEVTTDRSLLYIVLQNIISNAIKFSHPEKPIRITSSNRRKALAISVVDQGIGISDELLPTLTDITKPVSTPGTKQESGSGLGLIICKELVKIMGGEIIISSKQDKGTEVTLLLRTP